MSHFTTIQTQIKDIRALKAACNELGLNMIENTLARGYSTNQHKGDFVIKLKGPYDIAVNKQPDGAYGFTCDWWGGYVEKETGPNYGKIIQLYGVYKAAMEAAKKGFLTTRQKLANGSIKLFIQGV